MSQSRNFQTGTDFWGQWPNSPHIHAGLGPPDHMGPQGAFESAFIFHSIPLMAPMIVVMHENMVQTPPKSAHPCDPIHSTSTTVQSQEPYHTIRWSRPQEHTMHQHQVPFWPCGNTKWAPTNGSFGTSFGGLRAAGAAPYMHSCIPPHNRDSMGATGPCSCAWAHAEACACISCSSTAGSGGDGMDLGNAI